MVGGMSIEYQIRIKSGQQSSIWYKSPFSRLQIGAHIVEVAKKRETQLALSSCIPMQPFFEFSLSFCYQTLLGAK